MRCRVCNELVKPLEVIDNCRYKQFTLKQAPFSATTKDIQLYRCQSCSHIQTEYVLTDDFYNSYTNMEGSSQYYGPLVVFDEKLIKIKEYSNSHEKLLEIGCGTGVTLRMSEKYFKSCLGIEPSKITYEIAKAKGLNVINDYFNKSINLEGNISAFICFQVFEHLSDLYLVLDYAYELLEPGGVGLINVPNGQRIIYESLYHQLTCEHINYFSPYSLAMLAKKSGFDILEIEDIKSTLELDLYIRKPKEPTGFSNMRERQRKQLQHIINNNKDISIWGAGAKGQIYNQLLDKTNQIKHIWDSSPEKKGLYVSGIDIQIEMVSQSAIDESDIIIIFASSYNKEIIHDLRKKYGYKNKIVYFDGEDVLQDF